MKQLRLLTTAILATSMSLFMFSCGSGDDKKADEAKTDTTTKESTPEPPPPPPAKPSNVAVIQHKVANFAKWKPAFESHDSARRAAGLKMYVLGRGVTDTNMVLLVMEMADANKAKEFASSKDLMDKMKEAGVKGKPEIDYIDVVMDDNSAIPQNTRLMVKHKVKDWDVWKKAFDSHKQARIDAGLIDRAIGHGVGDSHTVYLVFAVTDMAKAKAFTTSKDLKDKMTEAGVDGPPTFAWYNFVQKY